jgi:hypothetical protein
MTSPDIISQSTNAALREAAAKYIATVHTPAFIEGVDGFATAHLGLEEPKDGLRTLVTGVEESLAISVDGKDQTSKLFVNIDLAVPDGSPASIVKPGMYNKRGELDAEEGEFARPVERALTESEGQELIMDLHSIMVKIPQNRKSQ